MRYPEISIIIPTHNEEKFIEKSITSILNTSYPKDKMEILVVDGMSTDKTREIVNNLKNKYNNIKLLENKKTKKAPALNLGIKNATGEIILIADAHSKYEKDYVLKNVENLLKYNADNVGGIVKILPRNNKLKSIAIAETLKHPFGTGGASYRRNLKEPKETDTVPFGCYKKEIFKKVGLFAEELNRNMDIEFNLRLKRKGYKIMVFPDIIVYYYARDNFKDLFKNNFQNGLWVILSTHYSKKAFSLRHIVPLLFVLFLLFGSIASIFSPIARIPFFIILSIYLLLSIYFSFKIAMKNKNLKLFFPSLLSFWILHISYGLGSFYGLFLIL
ncbi:hypothetical protein JCM30566_19090 [Marinitoga arctica]